MAWRSKKARPPEHTRWSAKVGPYNFKVTGVEMTNRGVTYHLSAVAIGGTITLGTKEHVIIFDASGNRMVDITDFAIAGPITVPPGSEVILDVEIPYQPAPIPLYNNHGYTAAPQGSHNHTGTWNTSGGGSGTVTYQSAGQQQIIPFGPTAPMQANPLIPPNSVTVNQPRPRDTPKGNEHTFRDALIGHKVYTYELADGELIYGEFGWVTDLEYFDDRDGEIVLKRKRWLLLAEDEYILPDPHADDDE